MVQNLIEASLTVDQAAIQKYAEITDDYNPIHTDPEFARNTPFGDVIAHGTMSLSLIWQSATRTFGKDAVSSAKLNIRFSAPVRNGDIVTAGGKQSKDQDNRFDVFVRTQTGDIVIKGWLEL
ncbi:MaoC family dehydratase [Sneathiella sp.]|uniref:MaoC family dehydratase n=1 Tax=Sneathiella sp. TaxID=1964365 RepID=UPI0026055DEB|nr:MaoC family dehydratase [Sneathiella sp.]MDF2368517.1 MaoC family dehydratase [Sneathiella sp.]